MTAEMRVNMGADAANLVPGRTVTTRHLLQYGEKISSSK